MPLAAVITGEILDFEQLKGAQQTKLIDKLASVFAVGKVEMFNGGRFLIYIATPAAALEPLIQARILTREAGVEKDKELDIKACIALGDVTGVLRSLESATGEAFRLSRAGFDGMVEGRRLAMVCDDTQVAVHEGLQILGRFTDVLFRQLTAKQLKKPHAAVWIELRQIVRAYSVLVAQIK